MASAAADLLIGKIAAILENEASSIVGVRDQVDEIKLELLSMKSFLQDAEDKKVHTEVEKTWVASVRDLASEAEDIIEEFMYHMYEQQSGGRFARWLNKIVHFPKNLWYRRQVAKKLAKISRTIKAIPERSQRYNVGGVEGKILDDDIRKWTKNQAESSLFLQEDGLVGIEEKKQILMGWLLNEEQNRTVVSVLGMGGSGKTTLVAKTFANETVKRHFDCSAWITVSQTYVLEDMFRSLIKEFHKEKKDEVPADLNDMSYRDLLQMLVNYLESKRYIIVLDDVWDINLWREIWIALPNRQLGSRIMLTTRKEDVAFYAFGVESHVHRMQPLQENEAWELFSKKAFSTYGNKCSPPTLEPLAWKLLEKCEGLPLAIVALSGLMSSKNSSEGWSKVYNNLNWHLTNNPLLEPVKSILLLSYNDLPYRLKHCFLYCSLFPEDYSISIKKIIRLWMAEGFVEQVKGITPEEVAESYLMELFFRSMLQGRHGEGFPACKMHDLMRELALSTAEKEKFCVVFDGSEIIEEVGSRRLSIQTTKGEIKAYPGMSKLRSLLIFATDILSFSFSKTFPSGYKFLRVLELEGVPIAKLPDGVVYLFNLRYLSLRSTPIKVLPESIGQLRNLQTLDICHTKIEALPRGISKLLNFRHLHMGHDNAGLYIGVKVPSTISKLKNLQTLNSFESEGKIIGLLRNMTQLTNLGITNVKERDQRELCVTLQEMKLLRLLHLNAANEEEILPVDALSSPPPHLQRLYLIGKLEKVPHWFCSLQCVTVLSLSFSRLEEDLLIHIEALPNLMQLILRNVYVGKELCCNRGFEKLTVLVLNDFPLLSKITIEKGAMPNLQYLGLFRCVELKRLPQGFEYLTKLESFKFGYASDQFVKSIQEGGVDHQKLQRIPNYRIN